MNPRSQLSVDYLKSVESLQYWDGQVVLTTMLYGSGLPFGILLRYFSRKRLIDMVNDDLVIISPSSHACRRDSI